jgi:hypothetical protein
MTVYGYGILDSSPRAEAKPAASRSARRERKVGKSGGGVGEDDGELMYVPSYSVSANCDFERLEIISKAEDGTLNPEGVRVRTPYRRHRARS